MFCHATTTRTATSKKIKIYLLTKFRFRIICTNDVMIFKSNLKNI